VSGGFIYTYKIMHRVSPAGKSEARLDLIHKTTLDEVPYAMCPFQGRVLIGVGKLLRLYDLGKKKLLRKCENKVFVIVKAYSFRLLWKYICALTKRPSTT
jgi:splicing factor 3B subunit 3